MSVYFFGDPLGFVVIELTHPMLDILLYPLCWLGYANPLPPRPRTE